MVEAGADDGVRVDAGAEASAGVGVRAETGARAGAGAEGAMTIIRAGFWACLGTGNNEGGGEDVSIVGFSACSGFDDGGGGGTATDSDGGGGG
jgi:hypothetical protein